MPGTLSGALRAAVEHTSAPLYVVRAKEEEVTVDGPALGALAARHAASLIDAGVTSGTPVVIGASASTEFLGAFWGTIAIGAVPVPVPSVPGRGMSGRRASAVAQRIDSIARSLGPVPAIFSAESQEPIRSNLKSADLRFVRVGTAVPPLSSVLRPAAPDEVAILQFTSGSTNHPRGCPLTHAAVVANLVAIQERLNIFHPMTGVNWVPLYHDMGLIGAVVLSVWSRLLTSVLQRTEEFALRPISWLEQLSRFRAEISSMPSSAAGLVSAAVARRPPGDIELSCVTSIFIGAEPVDADEIREMVAQLTPYGLREEAVHVAYGMAESVVLTASRPRGLATDRIDAGALAGAGLAEDVDGAVRAGRQIEVVNVGRAVPGTALRIVDERGAVCPSRVAGRVMVRSDSLMESYHGEARQPSDWQDGWFHTKDLGYLVDGELHLLGRTDDVIIVGGQNYYAADVEQQARRVEGVFRGAAAAVGISSGGRTGLAIAFETRSPTPSVVAKDIAAVCASHIGVTPIQVFPVPPGALPRTSSGKIRRTELARRLGRQTGVVG